MLNKHIIFWGCLFAAAQFIISIINDWNHKQKMVELFLFLGKSGTAFAILQIKTFWYFMIFQFYNDPIKSNNRIPKTCSQYHNKQTKTIDLNSTQNGNMWMHNQITLGDNKPNRIYPNPVRNKNWVKIQLNILFPKRGKFDVAYATTPNSHLTKVTVYMHFLQSTYKPYNHKTL